MASEKTSTKPKAKAKAPKAKVETPEIVADEIELNEEENFEEKEYDKNEPVEFTGKYIAAVGRRKTSVSQVRLYENGRGVVMVNGVRASKYFPGEGSNVVAQPLKASGHGRDYNFSVMVKGGGKASQVEATRLGIARALMIIDPASADALKANSFLTRDPRKKERKKPGLKGARKRPQWSKR